MNAPMIWGTFILPGASSIGGLKDNLEVVMTALPEVHCVPGALSCTFPILFQLFYYLHYSSQQLCGLGMNIIPYLYN